MAYKAIVDFKDLQTGHDYKAGEVYPFEGTADEKRINMLATPNSQRGALIAKVPVVVGRKPKKTENKAEKPKEEGKEKK